jgi:hypothetical protein
MYKTGGAESVSEPLQNAPASVRWAAWRAALLRLAAGWQDAQSAVFARQGLLVTSCSTELTFLFRARYALPKCWPPSAFTTLGHLALLDALH